MPQFMISGQAEILRAAQKDESFKRNVQDIVQDILLRIGGTPVWMRYKHFSKAVGHLLYFGCTTLRGFQTLGEEYTGIVQVDDSLRQLPSMMSRLAMVLLDCSGYAAIEYSLTALERALTISASLKPEAATWHLLQAVSVLRAVLPFFSRLHKAIFYNYGGFYEVAKRLTGIRYILVRYWLRDKQSLYGFRILGAVTLLHLIAYGAHSSLSWWQHHGDNNRQSGPQQVICTTSSGDASPGNCPLCMEELQSVCATPCGHLFCWLCVMEWLQEQQHCPICREDVAPSRVVPLCNYS